MRIERSATSLSWIPSNSIPGLMKLPFAARIMHYDAPPPLELTDLEAMQQQGRFRFANKLSAYIEVEDGKISSCGYSGGLLMGRTPLSAGPVRVLLPTKGHREMRSEPRVTATGGTFVQTVGGRPLFSLVWPVTRWPFLALKPFTIWTTLELTINVDGSYAQRVVGSSPFPRHWLYDNDGHLVQKTALTRAQMWAHSAFGRHTPWGGEDQRSVVSGPETPLERAIADRIMRGGQTPLVRNLRAGEFLFHQGEPGGSVALVLDGNVEVRSNGRVVGEAGPGAVVGERSWLEAGTRTADLWAATDIRVAEVPAADLDPGTITELASGHHREVLA
jgi:hypothetical protein